MRTVTMSKEGLSVVRVGACRNSKVKTPPSMEQVQRENGDVCRRYQQLIQRTKNKTIKENLRLELQRRLVDNLTAGRAKQAQYSRELQEQKNKLADMAARKLKGSGEGATPEDRNRQELFARILHYEDTHELPLTLQGMLTSKAKSMKAARHVVMHILGDPKHPLSQWLSRERAELQQELAEVLNHGACQRDEEKDPLIEERSSESVPSATAVSSKVVSVVRTAMLMLGLAFEHFWCEDVWDTYYGLVEDHFVWSLWPQLMSLLRIEKAEAVQRVTQVMDQLSDTAPDEMHVPAFLWQHQGNMLDEAIEILGTVPRLSPSQKLRVLVHMTRLVCTEPQLGPGESGGKSLGADDLVSTLSYMLVQTRTPELYLECLTLEQVLDSR